MAVRGVTCQDPAVRWPLHGPMDVTQQQETSPRRNVGNERGGGGSEDEGGEGLEQSASVTVVVPRRESQADKWVSGYQPETS